MSSQRLKELQEMEQQIQKEVETGEIQPASREVNLGAGSFRVADSEENELEERKQLLRRRLAAKEQGQSAFASWRLWAVVGITILSCIMLLWALFVGGTPDKYVAPSKCILGSELRSSYETGKRESMCPEEQWLLEECLDERRVRSKTTLERCSKHFEECEYDLALLEDCNLLD